MKHENIFYFKTIYQIGGVESFFYYMAKKYRKKDITIVYSQADAKQVARLKQHVRVIRHNKGDKIECRRAFFNYNLDIIDDVIADEYCQIIHANYKAMKINPKLNERIDKYIAVSEHVAKTFKELTGAECEVEYNPYYKDEQKKVLHLVSATRLSEEKGRWRMEKLANELDKHGIPFVWLVFTTDKRPFNHPSVVKMKPRPSVLEYVADADFLVQLSDTEGFCYSVEEALSYNTPVIVTDMDVIHELGVKDRENGFVLPFNMKEIPIAEIYDGLPEFQYKPLEDGWSKRLGRKQSTYLKELEENVLVKPIRNYTDTQLNRYISKNEPPFLVSKARAAELINANVCEMEGGNK